MDAEEFRRIGHELIDYIADYRTRVAGLPVRSRVEPGEIKAGFDAAPPFTGSGFADLIDQIERDIMPGLSHWQHPSFFGYFPANSPLESVLGDLLSTGLGVLGLSWQSSPALSELEEVVTDWFRQMVGLDDHWSGVIQDTASTSTLVALLCARERATGYSLARDGLQGEPKPLTIYASAQAHSSVEKAALLAGFGRNNVRSIETDNAFAMRVDQLAEAIDNDLALGFQPCAVIATAGTTATTAFDPIEAVAVLVRDHGLWLHVDAAMAGSAMILPEYRDLWEGVDGADSLVINAHKWLGAAFDCSLYYVRDPEHLVRVMSTNPSYLQTAADDRVKNLRDWGIPLGRRFRAMKLWLLIRANGIDGLRDRLRRDLENARWLEERVRDASDWVVVAPVRLQTVCVRHVPPGLEGEALDQHTLEWCERINASGAAYLTPAIVDGRWTVRVSIGAVPTERKHVEALWDAMRTAAER